MFCMFWSCCCTGHAGWVQGWWGWGQMAARHSQVPWMGVRTCTCVRHYCTRPATAGSPHQPQANATTLWVHLDNAYEDPNTEFRVNQVSQVIIMTSPVTSWFRVRHPHAHTQPLHIQHTCRQHPNQHNHTTGRGVGTTVLQCTAHWRACTAC